jgi:hypothetical protein
MNPDAAYQPSSWPAAIHDWLKVVTRQDPHPTPEQIATVARAASRAARAYWRATGADVLCAAVHWGCPWTGAWARDRRGRLRSGVCSWCGMAWRTHASRGVAVPRGA